MELWNQQLQEENISFSLVCIYFLLVIIDWDNIYVWNIIYINYMTRDLMGFNTGPLFVW
mgnify:CR=1 FL=1